MSFITIGAVLGLLLVGAAIGFNEYRAQSNVRAIKPSLCAKGQHAILVGFGKDEHGNYLATYGCQR